ncbi:MAG: hypothetical protein HYS17_00170 [Micavibrio aeruginosavorus]|uniref:Uncharacterized protein n=1 Tax=Micavibrio aeruginosavorus TaxID=349221 RepID=A0A7T5UGG3_9BACT|nr:MAG: hypothetical protein HYS17_00170 [Micavibrio aeruginosavorus]
MERDLLLKRDQMIAGLHDQLAGAAFAAATTMPYDTAPLQSMLRDMASEYGHDADTQGHIMLALEDLLEYCSMRNIRQLSALLAQTLAERKGQTAGGSESRGYEAFENKLASYWRLLLMNDDQLARDQKYREIESVCAHTISFPLRQQADAARSALAGFSGSAFRPPFF